MSKVKFYPFGAQTASFVPKPIPATKNIPDWYKRQRGEVDDSTGIPQGNATSTIKRCMPIYDSLSAGYILSMPVDIYIDATNPLKLEWNIPLPMHGFKGDLVASHDRRQYDQYPYDRKTYHDDLLRIMPFWSVGTDEGYSTMFMHPWHSDTTPLHAIGAVIDTDRFISDGHFSFLVDRSFKGIIKQGTPIVQVIPFKRDSYEMEIVDSKTASAKATQQRLDVRSVFKFGYKTKMRAQKDYK